jgi:hypothetical protein
MSICEQVNQWALELFLCDKNQSNHEGGIYQEVKTSTFFSSAESSISLYLRKNTQIL